MRIDAVLNEYLLYKRAERLSPATLSWYADLLGQWIRWKGSDVELSTVAPVDVALWLSEEGDRGLAPASVDARWRALSAFFSWCVEQEHIERSPLRGKRGQLLVRRPRRGAPVVRHVTMEEYRRWMAGIEGDGWQEWRDRAIGMVLMWSGLRLAELAALSVPDLDLERLLVLVRHGKGDRARLVPVLDDLRPVVLRYLMSRPEWAGDELWLAVASDQVGVRGRLTGEGIRQMLMRRCKRVGIRVLNPHAWRHGSAMALLNGGLDMSAVSKLLGHSSEAVTGAVYARWVTSSLQREFRRVVADLHNV